MSRILETTDYDKFDLLPFNRDLHDTRFLESSMREHGFLDAYPLHVVRNGPGKLKIKTGHHRFAVAAKLKIPLKYVICDDNAPIHELEKTTTRWTLRDYLDSYVRLGYPAYLIVRDYHEHTGIPLGLCTALLGGQQGSANFYDAFKAGTYKVSDKSIADPVADLVLGCVDLGIDFARNSMFVEALAQCWLTDEFDIDTFLTRVSANQPRMKKMPTKADYLDLIEHIYNFKSQNKVPLAFLAKETARKRLMLFNKRKQKESST